jgi:hypothetical protein
LERDEWFVFDLLSNEIEAIIASEHTVNRQYWNLDYSEWPTEKRGL